jgi:hypothetical protein
VAATGNTSRNAARTAAQHALQANMADKAKLLMLRISEGMTTYTHAYTHTHTHTHAHTHTHTHAYTHIQHT